MALGQIKEDAKHRKGVGKEVTDQTSIGIMRRFKEMAGPVPVGGSDRTHFKLKGQLY